MIDIKYSASDNIADFVNDLSLKQRNADIFGRISREARAIMDDVRDNGWPAVERYSLEFDGKLPYELSAQDISNAAADCPPLLYAAMERAAANIREYQSHLIISSRLWDTASGQLGQLVYPLSRVGVYVPGGTAAYPSTILMCAIPAQVAGVGEIILLTPPTANLNTAVMAAAKIAGIKRVLAVGGAQAIAALTFGVGFVPKVDKIVGPGSAYVQEAKRYAYGSVDIDSIAGPSEILIIADSSANPAFCAADMLSQAEHDPLAASILITDSIELAQQVRFELSRQTESLSRRDTIISSLQNFGTIIVCNDISEAVQIANMIAPEHLEILTQSPHKLIPDLRNAGAIFVGQYSPEPLGDYMAGPSHVLPTYGTARFFSPLSADSFLKRTSIIEFTKQGLDNCADDIIAFADSEGLTAHSNAVRVRKTNT